MTDNDTYPSVDTDEDDKKLKSFYPMPMPSAATAPMPSAMPAPEVTGAAPAPFPMESESAPAPTMTREPDSGLVRRGDAMAPAPINPQAQPLPPGASAPMPANPPKPIGPQPTWNQYAPPQPHGISRFGHALAALSPRINEYVNVRPEKQAEVKYDAATKEYEERVKEEKEQKAAQSEEELRAAQAKAYGERGPTAIEVANIRGENQQNLQEKKNVPALRKLGLDENGAPIPEEQLAPGERQTIGLNKARADLEEAEAGLAKFRSNPNSPMYSMALQRMQLAQQSYDLRAKEFGYNYEPSTLSPQDQANGPNVQGPQGPVPLKSPESAAAAPSGQTRSRADAAISLHEMIGNIRKLIADPEVKKGFGVLPGRVSEAEKAIGNAPPKVQQAYGALKSAYSMAGTMHGWRALQVADEFEKAFGGLHTNPDSLLGGMQALDDSAKAIAHSGNRKFPEEEQGGGNQGGGPPKPEPGMKVQSRTVNGKTEYRQVPIGQ